jgi:hypothetical protein
MNIKTGFSLFDNFLEKTRNELAETESRVSGTCELRTRIFFNCKILITNIIGEKFIQFTIKMQFVTNF